MSSDNTSTPNTSDRTDCVQVAVTHPIPSGWQRTGRLRYTFSDGDHNTVDLWYSEPDRRWFSAHSNGSSYRHGGARARDVIPFSLVETTYDLRGGLDDGTPELPDEVLEPIDSDEIEIVEDATGVHQPGWSPEQPAGVGTADDVGDVMGVGVSHADPPSYSFDAVRIAVDDAPAGQPVPGVFTTPTKPAEPEVARFGEPRDVDTQRAVEALQGGIADMVAKYKDDGQPKSTPGYYRALSPEPIDVIESWGLSFGLGCVVKYIARAGRKTADRGPDLRKALDYLHREVFGTWATDPTPTHLDYSEPVVFTATVAPKTAADREGLEQLLRGETAEREYWTPARPRTGEEDADVFKRTDDSGMFWYLSNGSGVWMISSTGGDEFEFCDDIPFDESPPFIEANGVLKLLGYAK